MARSWTIAGARRLLGRFGAVGRRHFDYATDLVCDALLGIDTFIFVPRGPIDNTARNGRYEPLPYMSLRTIARRLEISPQDVVLDLGCGKGRVLCFFAARGNSCIGVEISFPLAFKAKKNARRLRRRNGVIDVVHRDAAEVDIAEASVIFLYNPFSEEVMRPVLEHIHESLETSPRNLKICYANPIAGELLDETPWLVCLDQFAVTQNGKRGVPVKVWVPRSIH